MAGASVSGLVSGLDTATIISQLMQVEAQPQTMLKTRLSTEQSNVSTLQSLNAKFAALATKAHDLAKPAAWSPSTGTSSSDQVAVTAGSTAVPASLSLTVDQTATPSRITFDTAVGRRRRLLRPGRAHQGRDGLPRGRWRTGTLDELVAGINQAGAGVTATKLALGNGELPGLPRLRPTPGPAPAFTLSDLTVGARPRRPGQNAKITVAGDQIESPSNTFTGIAPGARRHHRPRHTRRLATADITRGPGHRLRRRRSLQSLVDAANDILTQIDKLTSYDARPRRPQGRSPATRCCVTCAPRCSTRSPAPRTAPRWPTWACRPTATARSRSTRRSSPAPTTRTRRRRRPSSGPWARARSPGFAARLEAAAKSASDSTTGALTQSITGRQSSVTSMQDGIADWDVRLALRKDALTRQFSALEVSLGKMQNQASWLSGQIAQLPTSG